MADFTSDFEGLLHIVGALAGGYCVILFYNGSVKGFEGLAIGFTGLYAIIIALKEHFEHSSIH